MCGQRAYEDERLEPPECAGNDHAYHLTPWCEAGSFMFREIAAAAEEGDERLRGFAGILYPVPEGLPEHVEDWYQRCGG